MKKKASLVLAFLLPFLIVGGLTVWHWYGYGLEDINRSRRLGEPSFQPGDEVSALKVALLFGGLAGTASGLVGIAAYSCFIVLRKRSQKPTNEPS